VVAFAPAAQDIAELLPYLTAEEQEQLDRLLNPDKPRPTESFRAYVDRVSRGRFIWYDHCARLAAVLQRIADGKLTRVMVFMPPRHGKSELISRYFSSYYLARFPERWVGVTSYGADLAYGLSRSAREHFVEAGAELSNDAAAVRYWKTRFGGGFWAAGVGGPLTGFGFHLGIIDDPLKNAEAAGSETIRLKQVEWYQSTFSTREEPGGAILLVLTRWNEDDLAGWILKNEAMDEEDPESWHIVHFPAIKEEAEPEYPPSCTVEPDPRQPGEPLCPERYPLRKLRRMMRKIGAYFWNALFQGRPRPKEGTFLKREWFEIVDAVPTNAIRARGWDFAATQDGGDYTVGVKMSKTPDGSYFIEDVVRGQWSSANRDRIIVQTANLDGRRVKIRGPQDPGSAGKDSALAFVKLLAGFDVRTEPVTGDKMTRAGPFASQAEVRNIKLVKGAWNKAFLDELCDVPYGRFDDQLDGTATAFNELHVRVATGLPFVPESESYPTM
jgi:predicted phage terminase large subunit-like protein